MIAGDDLLSPPLFLLATTSRAREITLGRVPANVTLNANLNLNINGTADLGFVIQT